MFNLLQYLRRYNLSGVLSKLYSYFGPRVYPMGSLVIVLDASGQSIRPSVGPSLNISEAAH